MSLQIRRLRARARQTGIFALGRAGAVRSVIALFAVCLAAVAAVALADAHEGHEHGSAPAAVPVAGSPRVVASSERYQFVGIVEGEVLVIYLDRADDNAPVTSATIEVSLDGAPYKAGLQEKAGTYEVTAPVLRQPGEHEVLVTIAEGSVSDLLVGTLAIPANETDTAHHRVGDSLAQAMEAFSTGRVAIAGAGLVLIAAAAGAAILGRRKLLIVPAAILGMILASTIAWAHEGHGHGPDLSASTGNSPVRRPDGTLFVPKPTQRLLEIRTRSAVVESRRRTVRFYGRIVPNPNRSGVVQATLQGRYEAPPGGVPPLGTKVRAGDLLGRVAPSFASIDSSDMMQTLGALEQEISLNRRKLARQEQLLASNAVTQAAVEDTRIALDGLEKRRRELLAARVRPEDLRAPVTGVIAAARVIAGQVVSPSDQLFQIIDPTSLMVEALVFDQVDPDAVHEASASVAGRGDAIVKLKFLGRSRALQQQYSLLQFAIVESKAALNAGAPVTVITTTGERATGFILPRAALVQAPSGQTVVFSHKDPEVFQPRAVRVEPFDSKHVLVTAGIAEGERIVVRNALLLNQVR
ncbi:MAG TPA: HlyD family efflux transporter periplasmic adaptor subunit [Hyphomicrobiaceae bacterium]|nr:HlyD family efflux transporter periplasmic adaptor subunit [Hyphomicrobiaceae bacterium]